MKTNVAIELSDTQRGLIANLIDARATSRLATRKEISSLCRCFLEALLVEQSAQEEHPPLCGELHVADAEDRETLANARWRMGH